MTDNILLNNIFTSSQLNNNTNNNSSSSQTLIPNAATAYANSSHNAQRRFSVIDYEAEQCIGKGTFGRVLRAKAALRTYCSNSIPEVPSAATQLINCETSGSNSCAKNHISCNAQGVVISKQCGVCSLSANATSNHKSDRGICDVNCSQLISKSEYYVAIKILRNSVQYIKQGQEEMNILKKLAYPIQKITRQIAACDKYKFNKNIVKMLSSFWNESGELCIVFELLHINLYELMKSREFSPLHLHEIRIILAQLCVGLNHLHANNVIHTDLKPENIMIVEQNLMPLAIKIIDLGSACSTHNAIHLTYLQSRYYRSPEIILALPFDSAVDIWSLGCVGVELFLGAPLYPGNSEYDLLKFIISTQGDLPRSMLANSNKTRMFFHSDFTLKSDQEVLHTLGERYKSKETRKYIIRQLSSLMLFESPDELQYRELCETSNFDEYLRQLARALHKDHHHNFYTNSVQKDRISGKREKYQANNNNARLNHAEINNNGNIMRRPATNFATLKVLHDLRPNHDLLMQSEDKLAYDKQLFCRESLARQNDKIEFVKLICGMMNVVPNQRCSALQALHGQVSHFLTMKHLLPSSVGFYPNIYSAAALDLNNDANSFCDIGPALPTTNSVFASQNASCSPQRKQIPKFAQQCHISSYMDQILDQNHQNQYDPNYHNNSKNFATNAACNIFKCESRRLKQPLDYSPANPDWPLGFAGGGGSSNHHELSNSTCDSLSSNELLLSGEEVSNSMYAQSSALQSKFHNAPNSNHYHPNNNNNDNNNNNHPIPLMMNIGQNVALNHLTSSLCKPSVKSRIHNSQASVLAPHSNNSMAKHSMFYSKSDEDDDEPSVNNGNKYDERLDIDLINAKQQSQQQQQVACDDSKNLSEATKIPSHLLVELRRAMSRTNEF